MELKDILPVLLPAVVLQLYIQYSYIKRCLQDERLSCVQRYRYAALIFCFSLPGAAIYLFRNGGSTSAAISSTTEANVAPPVRRGIFLLLVMAYEVMCFHLVAENVTSSLFIPLVLLLSCSFLCMPIYNLLPPEHPVATSPLLPLLQILLCVPVLFWEQSGDNLYLALIAGIGAMNHAPLSQAGIYGVGALGAYLLGSTARLVRLADLLDMEQILRYSFVNTLVVTLALAAFYTLKNQMVTGQRLAAALQQVQQQSEQLQGLAVVEERNRIASEMHDTVGHTLTAAVLSLEAATGSLTEQPPPAAQKLQQGKELVRRGLDELRASVRAVRTADTIDFDSALRQLVQEIMADTGLTIHRVSEGVGSLPPLAAGILLAAVKECATNAVRHGHASQADILVQVHQGRLRLTFTDNGGGTDSWQPGSGLAIMAERLQSVGGALAIVTAAGEGFTVDLTLPSLAGKEGVL